MPDEEKVQRKRRKLDSIITKLHQATPLESENVGEEENAVKCLFCHRLLRVNNVALYVSELRSHVFWRRICDNRLTKAGKICM